MVIRNILDRNKRFLAVLALGIALVVPFVSMLPVSAGGGKAEVCMGLGGCPDSDGRLQRVVEAALNIMSIIVGIAAVTMIVLAGLKYITAGGDAGKISSAQNTIIWAVVGIVVAALAQIIVQYVLGRVG